MVSKLLFSVFLLVAANANAAVPKKLQSKMRTGLAKSGETRLFDEASRGILKGESISASYVLRCTPGKAAEFALSSGGGHGSIIIVDDSIEGISMSSADGDVKLFPESVKRNAFGALTYGAEDGTTSVRFEYSGMPAEGGVAKVACANPISIVGLVKDEHDYRLDYEIVTTESVDGGASSLVRILDSKSDTSLDAEYMVKGGVTDANGRRHLKPSEEVKMHSATDKSVTIDSEGKNQDVVFVQVKSKSPDNGTIRRTIISSTKAALPAVESIELESSEINGQGDVEFQFSSGLVDPEQLFLLKTVVKVQCDGADLSDEIVLKAVTADFRLVLNGGWIKKLKAEFSDEAKDCKLFISEAAALDPENSYAVVGHMSVPVEAQIEQRRHLLAETPTQEELNISLEMKVGRRPLARSNPSEPGILPDLDRSNRRLEGVYVNPNTGHRGARILSHGYCSDGDQPFPEDEFRYNIEFKSNENNWSNMEFATRILDFAEDNELDGCSLIAHSQGGLASLTIKNYFFSCLDDIRYAKPGLGLENSRVIQSVGSPYQGSPLAGNLAAIGDVFGSGCGVQDDITPAGAVAWLEDIDMEERASVWYYRTADDQPSFFSLASQCELGTELFLDDPEDGVVEVAKGALPGGNNLGVAYKQCHSEGMNYQAQCLNKQRNSQMNQYGPV